MKRASLKNELEVKDTPRDANGEPPPYSPAPARRGKAMLNVLIDPIARDQLKALVADNHTTVQAVIRQLINEYFELHNRKPIA